MLLRALLVVTYLQAISFCYAQTSEADSLENIIKTIPSDTSKVWHLNKLVTILREKDNNKAFQYAKEARDLALLLNYQRGLSQAFENLGWIHYRKGDYSKAFELSVEAMTISEKLNDKAAIARCLNNIAAINYEQKQTSLAIANFKKAYVVSSEIGDGTSVARSLNNIAFCFLGDKELDSAKLYAEWGLKESRAHGKLYLEGFALRTLGDVDLEEKNFDAALIKYQQVVSLADQLQNVFLKVSTMHRIGKAYIALNKTDEALAYLLKNISLARHNEFRSELERSLKLISEIYARRKEIAKAYDFQNQYLAVHDSLYQQRSSEQMALMQVKFDSEMKEAKIELLTKDAQLKQEEINSQRMWMYFSIGSLTLMAILAFVLLYSNRLKKRANDELELKNREIQLQAHQLKNLNITKDKLFSIISHDLRSPLASLRGLMDILDVDGLSSQDFISTSKKLRKNLDSVQEDLDNLLFWAQSQLNGLQSNPENLQLRPIVEEKIELFSEIARQKKITIMNEIDDSLSIVADKNHIRLVDPSCCEKLACQRDKIQQAGRTDNYY
jgi:signal transduction histidine kinase